MTTDILSAAIPTPTDADCLDLGALFAPLAREEIEIMLVRMLNKYPDEAGWIVQAARKPVDTLEISNEVATALNLATSISSVCGDLEAYVTRSSEYLKSGHVRNAVAVLESLTPPVVSWTAEQGPTDEMEPEDAQAMQDLYALLENAWQSCHESARVVESPADAPAMGVAAKTTLTRASGVEKQARQKLGRLALGDLAKAELAFHATLLADAKKKLTPSVGPMFSDPLRALNKKRAAPGVAATRPNANAAAAAAAASSSSAAPAAAEASAPAAASSSATAGTKRKAAAAASSTEEATEAVPAAEAEPTKASTPAAATATAPKKKAKK